jgi:hypothetical protein
MSKRSMTPHTGSTTYSMKNLILQELNKDKSTPLTDLLKELNMETELEVIEQIKLTLILSKKELKCLKGMMSKGHANESGEETQIRTIIFNAANKSFTRLSDVVDKIDTKGGM